MHMESALIRSYLDKQLEATDRERVDQHLAGCEACRAALAEQEAQRARVRSTLDALAPESEVNERAAYARFKQKQESATFRIFPATWARPVAATLAAVAVLAAAFSVPAVRLWASNFLSLFRVQQVSIVQIDPAGFESLQRDFFNSQMAPRLDQLFSDTVQRRQNGSRQAVASVEEAGRVAGFGVRLPASASKPSRISVEPSFDLSFVVDVPRLQALLEDAGRGDVRLPESVNGQMVSAHIPASVAAFYGDCPADAGKEGQSHAHRAFPNCRVLVQLPGPTVAAPPDFDIVGLSTTVMQVLGMTPEQARLWSESIDWTSTLVIPVPRDPRMQITEIMIDGVKGTLITVPNRHEAPPAFNVLWVRDGILYTFIGQGQPEQALQILSSM